MAGFFVYPRGNIYYARIKNPRTGKYLTAKSTGTRDKAKAEFIAQKWIYEGIPSGRAKDPRTAEKVFLFDEVFTHLKEISLTDEEAKRILSHLKTQGFIKSIALDNGSEKTLIEFLSVFWDYDRSPYIQEKLTHGHSITRSHARNNNGFIEKHWKPYFLDIPLTKVNREQLKQFSTHLSRQKKTSQKGEPMEELLSPQSINHILKAGSVALRWASDNGIIQGNPADRIMKFSGKPQRRGILTDDEVTRLFTSGDWGNNEGARLGNLLASRTGLRAGEVIALQVRDIGEDRLFIRHSFGRDDGLKTTKNGEERQVPILPELREELLTYARRNPHGVRPDSFVFYQVDTPEKPIRIESLLSRLIHALDSIEIKETERKARGIVFHSWRHYYSRKMADALDERTAKLTGHKSKAMLEHYANHAEEKDFQKAAEATAQVFGRVLPFRKVE